MLESKKPKNYVSVLFKLLLTASFFQYKINYVFGHKWKEVDGLEYAKIQPFFSRSLHLSWENPWKLLMEGTPFEKITWIDIFILVIY